jgi:outer membrane immunogenic protein
MKIVETKENPMNRFALGVAVVAAMMAAPACAEGEARVEARGGIAWASGDSYGFAGVGGGYDVDLGERAFIGFDLGADKVLASGTDVFVSVGGRFGARVGDEGRLYVGGGAGFCCGGSDPYAGAGYQHDFGRNLYGKIEYRHSFADVGPDVNFIGVGLGVRF